jgi:hypothetical protein
MLAIFCHIGNYNVWLDIKTYLDRISIEYDLYINISEMVSDENDKLIRNVIKARQIFRLPNKGCDTGPLLYVMNYLRENNIEYEDIIFLHTKTDDKWRREMLDYIFENLEEKIKTYEKIEGNRKCMYDYYNYYYDIEYLDKANVEYIKDWKIFDMMTEKQYDNDFERLEYLQKNIEYKIFSPHIFCNLYEKLFGKQEKYKQIENINEKIFGFVSTILKNQHKLYYYPGTFFIFKHKIFNEVFKTWDLMKMYDELEEGKPNDIIYQSRTHALERVIPIGIQLYKKKDKVITTLHLFDILQIEYWIMKINLFTLNNSNILNTIYINIPNDYNIDKWNMQDIQINKELDIRYNVNGNEKIINICNYIYTKFINKDIVFIVSPNIGVDIGGYFYCLKEVKKDNKIFNYIIKLHTKTDIKKRNILSSILNINIEEIKKYNIVYPKEATKNKNDPHFLANNILNIRFICKKINIEYDNKFYYVSGTMFIVDYIYYLIILKYIDYLFSILNDIDSIDINWCYVALNFKKEIFNENIYNYFKYIKLKGSDQIICDGCMEHGIERIFGLIQYKLYNNNIYYTDQEYIEFALYGANNKYIDVKDIIKEKIKYNNNLIISNEIFTDPIYRQKKQLIIKYENKDIIIYNENDIYSESNIKFSIVIATFNRPNGKTKSYLLRALNSIINQTYHNWDIILIGDKYEPESELLDIINEIQQKTINNIIYLKNLEPERDYIKNKNKLWMIAGATSMNIGLNYCRQRDYQYYCHLDDDDYWDKIHLETIYNIYKRYNNCIFTCNKSTYENSYLPNNDINIDENNLLPTPCGMIHSSITFRCDIIPYYYYTNKNEDEIKNPADAIMLYMIRDFILKNKQYCSIYIPRLTCYHDIEGELKL